MKLVGRVASVQEKRTEFWWGNVNEGYHLEDLGAQRWIILKRILNRVAQRALDSSDS
jgi:hypothetical protein